MNGRIIYLFFLLSLGVFLSHLIIFSNVGLKMYFKLKEEVDFRVEKVQKLVSKIDFLNKEIFEWENDKNLFKVEKIAREELQMAHNDENIIVY